MQAKQEATSNVNQEQSDLVPIFKMKLPNYSHLDAIDGYHQFFSTKVAGSWLIRESRVQGMISLTFKRENSEIAHTRFAFLGDKWGIVDNKMRDKHLDGSSTINYEHVDKESAKSKFELLLEAIHKFSETSKSKLVFKDDRMIIPIPEQATPMQAYYVDCVSYVLTKQRTKDEVIYANLLQSLDKVKEVIRGCIDTLNADAELKERAMDCLDKIQLSYKKSDLSHMLRNISKPFQSSSDAQAFKELLDTWLEANALTFDLMCPVLHALFEEPYYVVETGMVYDAAALFYNGTCLDNCPLTQVKIQYNPVHLDGYRRALYETLELFFDLVELYQEKTSLLKEKQEDLSNLSLLSIFAPPLSEVANKSSEDNTKVDVNIFLG
ncbi:hypothetical protein J2N86_08370 [Legionella lytica]|uniref:Uncharacterized protein n=1 Tax=Legionella lytica TaxID=96232 RepID=A0ABY4Y665_9GAMM|nr:hypothetical protein [Legionella lytica]USQ12725.1 hypothetical protein J2N86_08370 [Legionella lytica]